MGQSIVKNPRKIFSQQGGGGGSTVEPDFIVLYKNNVNITHTGTVSETKLFSFLIPANTFQANDHVRFVLRTTPNSSSNTRTSRIKFNTSDALGGTQVCQWNTGSANVLTVRNMWMLNSLASQRVAVAATTANNNDETSNLVTANLTTLSIDFTVDQWLIYSGELVTSSADTLTISQVLITVTR